MPVQFTTTLPDEDAPVLGNGVEDEIAVDRETATTNYGDIRIQIRETGQSAWDSTATGFAEQLLLNSTLTTTFVGLEDGEEYELRARSETEHVTGAWTTPVSIVTKFPGATSLTVDVIGTGSADLSWVDNADNEDGFDLEHRRIYASGPGPWQTIQTLASNTTTATDAELVPDETYDFRVVAFTEDASASSNVAQATTASLGLDRSNVPARGWHVELDHPNGRTVIPRVRDGATFRPALNDLPDVTIPVDRTATWLSTNWEGASIRVWRDGERLPIDRLDDVEITTDRVELTAVGGGELQDRVTASYSTREAWLAVRDDLIPQTSYGATVDDPASGGTDTEMQSATTTAELEANRKNPLATDPIIVANGELTTAQTCFTQEGEAAVVKEGNPGFVSGSEYSGGQAETLVDGGDALEWTFTTDYTIPASAFEVAARYSADTFPDHTWTLILDGGGSVTLFTIDETGGTIGLGWQNITGGDDQLSGALGSSDYAGPDIPPGTHTLRLDHDGGTNATALIEDVVAPYDNRFDYTFPESTGPNGFLVGPELKPDAFAVIFDDADSAFNVGGGSVTATLDNLTNQQALALSNDGGASYTSASNTDSFSTTFGAAGSSIGLKVTLSRYGSRTTATPTQGFQGQTLDSYTLSATLEDSPLLINQRYDDSLLDILQSIADYGNFVFQLVWDSSAGQIAIEWTKPGQRTADASPPLADYALSKQLGAAYDKAIIYGAAQAVEGESFTANHGTAVALDNDILVEISETVVDPSSGVQFVNGTDYELDVQAGTITTLASGAMTDGATYEISYRWKVRGSYTSPDAPAEPRTVVRTIPSITSDRGCSNAALYLIQKVGEPLFEATLTVPRRALGLELVSAQSVAGLPGDQSFVIWGIDESAGEARLQLGTRKSVDEYVSELQSRLGATSKRV